MDQKEAGGFLFLVEDGNLSVQGSNAPYAINIETGTCGCPSFKYSSELPQTCKHIRAAVKHKDVLIPWRDKSVVVLED
jgi:SWIM zinc finger